MLFDKISPEAAGIKSKYIRDYISVLERHGLTTHSVLMMRGENIFAEYYWAPFDKDFLHRMYSQTKSYVSVAIGLLEEEGKLSLDDKIVSHFPEMISRDIPEYLREQTIRDMLMMETAVVSPYWFDSDCESRTYEYINRSDAMHPAGTIWRYDSAGSQVLSSLAEKFSGMPLLDYLKMKIFDKIGTFRTARILKTRNEDSWGDSALLCTARDMASFGRFVMNLGEWGGERLMNEKYLRDATSALCDNCEDGYEGCFRHGYGYQIWKTERDGFAFVGMGDQITICVPEKDFIFVITSDNQHLAQTRELLVDALFDIIVENLGDKPEEVIPEDVQALEALTRGLKLRAVRGKADAPFAKEINGKRYVCESNPMGIKEFTLSFDGTKGELYYINAQGEKRLFFGMGYNEFGKFPELGYSNEHGGAVTTDGFTYKCAASGAWREEKKLMLRCNIIDNYFGNLTAIFAFKGDMATVKMVSNAENFLKEYRGELVAKASL